MVLSKYTRELKKITDKYWRHRRLEDRIIKPIHRNIHKNPNGICVMDENWDNLVILDACRVDVFEDTVSTDRFDNYRVVISGGSGTPEWVRYNFKNKKFGDTVYISANPYPVELASGNFHKMIDISDGWEDGEVTADVVTETTKHIFEDYPNKRLIIHFMQPHTPFVTDNRIPKSVEDGYSSYGEALNAGVISKSDAYDAFVQNLEHVIQPALDLSKCLTGKTVITSDHGNMLGERTWPVPIKLYGHSPGVRTPQLNNVPWAEINSDSRRRIKDDGTSDAVKIEKNSMNKRLKALGYK